MFWTVVFALLFVFVGLPVALLLIGPLFSLLLNLFELSPHQRAKNAKRRAALKARNAARPWYLRSSF